MKCLRALLFVLVFFAPAATQASPILPGSPDRVPLFFVCAAVGDIDPVTECADVSDAIGPVESSAGKLLLGLVNVQVLLPAGQIAVSATFNPDPFISFGATTTNLTPGPVTYAFLFGTPVTSGFYNVATSTGGVTVTNGASGTTTVDNSVVYPTYISGYGTVGSTPTNLGVDLGTAPCTAGPGTPFTMTSTCPQGTTSNSFAPTFFDNLEALLTYTQSDGVASWSGAVTLDGGRTVPEPALLGLFGAALVGSALRRRRK